MSPHTKGKSCHMHQMLLIAYRSQLLFELTHTQEHLLKAYKYHLLLIMK